MAVGVLMPVVYAAVPARPERVPEFVFDKTSDRAELSEVWMPGQDGIPGGRHQGTPLPRRSRWL